MKVLFDQGAPVPLRGSLSSHQVDTAAELGWSDFSNGELLSQAEAQGYECLITTDQNLKYQQNLDDRSIRIFVLMSTSWPKIQNKVVEIRHALEVTPEGGYIEIDI